MAPRPRHTSRSRRRSRRANERAEPVIAALFTPEQDEKIALLAAASGSTSLPLSDQGDSWDASAAVKGLTDAQLPNAHFWKDPDGDPAAKSSYKLPFAENRSGTLTAVWRGVTASAGAVQGARGGVQIPSGDVAGVKAKIGAYYTKAAKQYDDPDIKPPWAASSAAEAAFLLTYAEMIGLISTDADRFADADDFCSWEPWATLPDLPTLPEVYAPDQEVLDTFVDLLAVHHNALDPEGAAELANADEDEDKKDDDEYGGKPSQGTDKDRRLKKNQAAADPRDLLVSVREQLAAPTEACANCDHAFADHAGTDGACGIDGCSCDGYVTAAAAEDVDDFADTEVPLARIGLAQDGPVTRFVATPAYPELPDGDPVGASLTEAFTHLTARLENFELTVPTGEELPAPNGPQPVISPPADGGPASGELRWVADIVPEATLTDDGRAMAPGSLTWRELPLSLMAMTETSEGGHVGAEVAGRIDNIYREGNMLKATGIFDSGDYGQEIGRLVGDGTLRGVSVDLAIHQYEVGPRSDYFDEDGNWLTEKPERAEAEEPPTLLDLLFGDDSEDAIFVVTEGVIGAVTVCPFQAFADATISLAAAGSPAVWTVKQQAAWRVTEHGVAAAETATEEPGEALTASAAGLAPEAPPAAWFDDPELEELTPLTITDEGFIYGHAAAWDTCHLGIPDVCTTAPASETNYAYFLLKEVLCADGERVPCGTITLETGHADRSLGRGDATAHYDNTGTAVADVNVGEDEFGIWVAGALRPDVDAEKARELRGAVLSGDWRSVNGNLELVALLAVNVPGFPVPRARALVAAAEDGPEVLALVAAGITIGHVEATDEIGLAQLSPIQQEKLRVFEAVAAGRFRALAERAANEGVVTPDEVRESAGFTADGEEEETPAPLAPQPHTEDGDEPVGDEVERPEGEDA